MEQRQNPDEILARLKTEESHRGKLKIFFGAMAGVGKTYAMLEAARGRKKEGIDVAVGLIETHKRAETEALLAGLEILPLKKITYKNIELPEFDIDLALKKHPQILLVDELAHTNAPGSRHVKRWQDVEELLDAGIDVYTTLNVQHYESANDVVAQITGITVRETVPDTFVEKADDIELVDLPPEELLKRLKEGKVYLGEQATRALENFFQIGNLIALRQLALQYTSKIVDVKMRSYKQAHSVSKVWNVRDRFLVSISPSPRAMSLIRTGKRIASSAGVEWVVAFVEIPTKLYKKEDKDRIAEMMRFAEKLGAETITLSGQDVSETLIAFARSRNLTKIIVGKPGKPRWHELIFGSVIEKLSRRCGEIDLYLISGDIGEQPNKVKPSRLNPFPWKGLIWTILIIALCSALNFSLYKYLHLVNLIMLYLLGVAFVAFRYGRRMSIIAAVLSVVCYDYLFIPPRFSFQISDAQYLITLAVMLIVGFVIGSLTGRLKQQAISMRIREKKTEALFRLSKDLAKTSVIDELFQTAATHTKDFFDCPVIILSPNKNHALSIRYGDAQKKVFDANEAAVAQWAFDHEKMAGKNTDTLPASKGLYIPFIGTERTVGTMGIFPIEAHQFSDPDQIHMLEMFVTQTALAIEGAQLAAEAIKTEAEIDNQRFRNMLLSTFSLDLSGPLKTISDTVSELLKPQNLNDESLRDKLLQKIRTEVEGLNSVSSEMTRIITSEERPK